MAPGDELRGRRVTLKQFYDNEYRQPGDYCGPIKSEDGPEGAWYICDPKGQVGGLYNHKIEEHGDGSISVSPSILDNSPGGYHGFLEHGVWREC